MGTQCTIDSDMETPSSREALLLNKFKTHLPQLIQTSIQCTTGSDMEILSSREAQLLNFKMLQSIQTSTQCTTGSDTETLSSKEALSPNKFKTHPHQSIQTSTQCTTGSDTEILSSNEALLLPQPIQFSIQNLPLVLQKVINQDSEPHTLASEILRS